MKVSGCELRAQFMVLVLNFEELPWKVMANVWYYVMLLMEIVRRW